MPSIFLPKGILDENNTLSEDLRQQIDLIKDAVDALFTFLCAAIVFFMQAGFAMLECGSVRVKNTTNVLVKNWLDAVIGLLGALGYWLVGYSLAFGSHNAFIGGSDWLMSQDIRDNMILSKWFFQYVFTATASTIVSGAVAERCSFEAYIVYSILISSFMYPVSTHWIWHDEGWLKIGANYSMEVATGNESEVVYFNIGFKDYAGGGAVHLLGGVAALIAAAMLGPRLGRFENVNGIEPITYHSIPFIALGGFILTFGFLAFNGGSQGSITNEGDVESVMNTVCNTVVSGSGGALTCIILSRLPLFGEGKWSLLTMINGTLCGMVAICAGAEDMYRWSAFVVGIIAGIFFILTSNFLVQCRVDDPVDAVAVHGAGGAWGVIARGLFSRENGVLINWTYQSALQLAWQTAGLLAIIAWSTTISLVTFGFLKILNRLRVPIEYEMAGMDILKHGEPAYPLSAQQHSGGHQATLKAVIRSSNGSLRSRKVIKAFASLQSGDEPSIASYGGIPVIDNFTNVANCDMTIPMRQPHDFGLPSCFNTMDIDSEEKESPAKEIEEGEIVQISKF